ncbi:MAG: twin-arginine translocase TatA/TatE family subunit [Candidatus Dormibacteraeota bacterium]|nr:twin-arginine translocase TatA/TatE family subunit [Candidatus Dormibacteraeota bacterium]
MIVLIVWGPGKLPEIGSAVGRAMHEFRKQSSEFQDEIRRSATPESRPETYQSTPVTPTPASPAPDVKPAPPVADVNPTTTPDPKS